MEKKFIKKSEIDLIMELYFEEKMTIQDIERVTPFDTITIDLIIKTQLAKLTKLILH